MPEIWALQELRVWQRLFITFKASSISSQRALEYKTICLEHLYADRQLQL